MGAEYMGHGMVFELSCSKDGCRLVQKALEVSRGAERDALVAELQGRLSELFECPNGNHVVQKMVEVLPASKLGFLFVALCGKAVALAKKKFGCRVIQRVLEHCTEQQDEMNQLLDELEAGIEQLVKSEFGNFVVQHILEHAPERRRRALNILLPRMSALARNRFGTYIVQQLLSYSDQEGQCQIADELLHARGEDDLVNVACSRHGSYAIEALVTRVPARAEEVRQRLAAGTRELETTAFGKRVAESLELEAPAKRLRVDA